MDDREVIANDNEKLF